MKDEKRPAGQCEYEPQVEVEQQISNIESPRFGTENVGAFTCTPENIVGDNIPWNHD